MPAPILLIILVPLHVFFFKAVMVLVGKRTRGFGGRVTPIPKSSCCMNWEISSLTFIDPTGSHWKSLDLLAVARSHATLSPRFGNSAGNTKARGASWSSWVHSRSVMVSSTANSFQNNQLEVPRVVYPADDLQTRRWRYGLRMFKVWKGGCNMLQPFRRNEASELFGGHWSESATTCPWTANVQTSCDGDAYHPGVARGPEATLWPLEDRVEGQVIQKG